VEAKGQGQRERNRALGTKHSDREKKVLPARLCMATRKMKVQESKMNRRGKEERKKVMKGWDEAAGKREKVKREDTGQFGAARSRGNVQALKKGERGKKKERVANGIDTNLVKKDDSSRKNTAP